jgi:exonuclease III
VEHCLNKTDILVIQEHWLYPDSISFLQSLHYDFTGWGRSSNEINLNSLWRRGKGGIAILWRKSLNANIQIMHDIGNDRIIAVQVTTDDKHNFYIIGAYLPSAKKPILPYKKSVDELEDVINQLSDRGPFIVLGDLNCHIGTFGGPRSFNKINERGKHFII